MKKATRTQTKAKKQSNTKHGVYRFIQSGKLSKDIPGHFAIRKRLNAESRALLDRFGDDTSFAILCRNQVYCDTVIELMIAELALHGVLDKAALAKGEIKVREVVKNFATFLNASRRNVTALEKLKSVTADSEEFDVVAYSEKKYGGKKNVDSD